MFHLLPLPPDWLRWFQTELTGGAGCVVSSFLLGFRSIKSCLFSGTYILLCWPCCTSVQFNPVANRGFLVVFFEIPGWKFEGLFLPTSFPPPPSILDFHGRPWNFCFSPWQQFLFGSAAPACPKGLQSGFLACFHKGSPPHTAEISSCASFRRRVPWS